MCALQVKERQLARFDVKVIGRPYPAVQWFKDGIPIQESGKHKLLVNQEGIHSLLISMVDHIDTGMYTCIAYNPGGDVQCSARLNVHSKT